MKTRYFTIKALAMVLLAGSSLAMTSCSDFLDVESRHAESEDKQWTSVADTRAALMGVYALTRAAITDNDFFWKTGELPYGDFTVRDNQELSEIVKGNFSTLDYSRFYTAINAAAVFIENASKTVAADQAYSEQNMKWDVAQARVLRAFLYYELARVYGDVPLVKYSYDNGSFPQVEVSSQAAVLSYAKDELKKAAKNLPQVFGSKTNQYYYQEPNYWRGVLMNQNAAYTLLAHISAMTNNYADCETYCQLVIDNQPTVTGNKTSQYLETASIYSSTGLFSTDATTYSAYRLVGFVSPYKGNEARWDGHLENLTLAAPYIRRQYPEIYVSADSIRSMYPDTKDERAGIDTTTMNYRNAFFDMTATYPIFKKVNVVQDGNASDVDYAVFSSAVVFSRYEDIILLKAEAQWAQNRTSDALECYNELRENRGLDKKALGYDFKNDRNKVIDEIFNERRRELVGEGWRWFDLIRRQKLRKDNPELLQKINKGEIYWKK